MSTTTTNRTLVKAAGGEAYSVTIVNTNLDLVDAAFSPSTQGTGGAQVAMLRETAITSVYSGATSASTLNLTPTWNTSGTVNGLSVVVTHTAAGAASRAIVVKRGSNTIFDVDVTTAAAVNGVGVLGSATGVGATLRALGGDTNIDLLLVGKGSGVVKAGGIEVVTLTAAQTLTQKSLTSPTLTGTVAGTPTWASSQAITLSTAAQAGVTSVGTLTGLTVSGAAYVGDTSNADVTLGLTINQGAADDQILALKSSDVAHGMTGVAETDTFAMFRKSSGAVGGLEVIAFSEDTHGLTLVGAVTTADTTKSAAGVAPVYLNGVLKSGASVAGLGAGENLLVLANNSSAAHIWDRDDYFMLGANPTLFVGATSNAGMTIGLTINQGAAGNEALALKGSDIIHGMTGLAETDTYAAFGKQQGAGGGLLISGYSEGSSALTVSGRQTTDDTTKSTTSSGVFSVESYTKSGTSVVAPGANANLAVIRSAGTTRFIFDQEGDSHQDVGTAWTNFDAYDDAALLNALAAEVARPDDPIRDEFRDWLDYSRDALTQARVVTFNDDGHHFVNMSKLTMLLVGAVRQQALRLRQMDARLQPLLEAR